MFEQKHLKRIYRLWAPVYDLLYHAPLASARSEAISSIAPGSRVLEVGIGTGLTVSVYPNDCQVIGIDLSLPMLKKAKRRVRSQPFSPVKGLLVMDAYKLGFADGSFDAVIATFVVGVVPNPQRVLDEMARVLRPGGQLIIANRVAPEAGFPKIMEQLLGGLAARVGWGRGLKLSSITPWAEKKGIRWISETRFLPGGLVRVIHLRQAWQVTRQEILPPAVHTQRTYTEPPRATGRGFSYPIS